MHKKLLIADDHYVIRVGTELLLHDVYEDLEIDFAENYEEVKVKISTDVYDLLMLDIDMPGSIYIKMVKEIKEKCPDTKILIFSAYDEKAVIQYINEGADGYLNKQLSENVVEAVTSIFTQGYYYPQEIMHHLVSNCKSILAVDRLSKREFEILKLIAEGNGNIEISSILNIKMSTISTFKKRIYEKLNLKNIVDIIKFYEKYNSTRLR